jgi:RHS repeat-associated protein
VGDRARCDVVRRGLLRACLRSTLQAQRALRTCATYTAYGTRTTTGTTSAFGYAGQYTDIETGLQWLPAPYYDPTTGQFLTVDPLTAATGTRYAYAGGDPITGSDPSGLICWSANCLAHDAAIAATVVGIAAAVTLLCVATACIGDVAIAAGTTTLAGTYAVAETVGSVATVAGFGAASVGGTADTFKAWNACSPYSSGCLWAVGGALLDVATFGAGAAITRYGPWQALWGIGSGGATWTYGKLTSDGGQCTEP